MINSRIVVTISTRPYFLIARREIIPGQREEDLHTQRTYDLHDRFPSLSRSQAVETYTTLICKKKTIAATSSTI